MAREKPYYREVLSDLAERFDGKVQLRLGEVADNFKMTPRTTKRRFSFDGGGYTTLYALARDICNDF